MVIAMTMAAIIQPIAIHRPPNTIHNRLSRKEVEDIKLPEGRRNQRASLTGSEWKLGLGRIGRSTIDRLRRLLFRLTTFAGLQFLRSRSAECPERT